MARCRRCRRFGFFLRVDGNGLCEPCSVKLQFKVANASRIIGDSIPIIEEGKNPGTRLSRCELVRKHADELLPYERLGITTLRTPPSEIISKVDWAERTIRETWQAGSEDVQGVTANPSFSYVDLVEPIKEAKRAGDLHTAERLLVRAISATEREAREWGGGVAPWYYQHLAIVYRKQRRFKDEVAVLERYADLPHAPGAKPAKLRERLTRAREIAEEKAAADQSRGLSIE